ncbi:hypothetical protein [Sphingomonas montanisoli]|uniref:Phage tail protein n=1 Tax=Sphingomonas montanisoli TaxID=2606412 RepID=A0A5D9C1V4_9SPHN|nr:hypothetical protein [Sphingomonas montanisoli]TZG25579.1 hypothetical protein FYJ91_11160 [Sphingomonas montanisoli]
MSIPNDPDFVLLKMGDGATPTQAFPILCGITSVNINKTANTTDKFTRDCAKPGAVPVRTVRTNGRQLDITGSGIVNVPQIPDFEDALGIRKDYKAELYKSDGSDEGVLMGHYAFNGVMTSQNMSLSDQGDSSGEVAIASHGTWEWVPAS